MRKIINRALLVLLVATISSSLAARYYPVTRMQSSVTTEKITRNSLKGNDRRIFQQIQFIDELWGWAATAHTLWKTDDGGKVWAEVRSASEITLLKNHQPQALLAMFQLLTRNEGWLLEDDYLLHTTDAGKTWQKQIFKNVIIRSFAFVSEKRGWAVGELLHINDGAPESWEGVIFSTSDRGTTWKKAQVRGHRHFNWRLFDVWPVTLGEVWVVGDIILKSVDGGKTWREVDIPDGVFGMPMRIRFASPSVGWIRTSQGDKYLLTTHGGKTWDIHAAPPETGGFIDLVYIDGTEAWGISKGLYRSTDSGKSWSKVSEEDFQSIQYLSQRDTLFVAGETVATYKHGLRR